MLKNIGHLLIHMDNDHYHNQHHAEGHRPDKAVGPHLINRPPCCALDLAMTQLLAVPSALHPAQKENETVVCVPSQGEVASRHLRQTYQLCFAVHQLHVLVGNQ